jgi:hypothetical protein
MTDEGDYCPLCGAHSFEYGEGETHPQQLEEWKEAVKALYEKLFPADQGS